jgi:hypothetical protein
MRANMQGKWRREAGDLPIGGDKFRYQSQDAKTLVYFPRC